jgi:hypothetical protein
MSRVHVRRSQVVSTFGPGALVDLPDQAVLIAGLEHWRGDAPFVHEPRLLQKLRNALHLPGLELRSPPVPDREEDVGVGVGAWLFPEWFIAQYEKVSKEHGRSRPLVHRRTLQRGRYVVAGKNGKPARMPVVPVRFVQGCPNGHISDIQWSELLHGPNGSCGGTLWIDERGTSGDLKDLWLRCDGCSVETLSLARLQGNTKESASSKHPLGACKGDRPWLGPHANEATCLDEAGLQITNRLLIRHASNAYFPEVERAISIPDTNEALRKAVDAVWEDFLQYAEALADVTRERRRERVKKALDGFTDDLVWDECQRRKHGGSDTARTLKEVELTTFLGAKEEIGEDVAEGDFFARRLPIVSRVGVMRDIDRVVLVHRLREVVVQLGFTRFESPGLPVDADVALNVRRAALSLNAQWLPAIENRGEGIFVALDRKAVETWRDREAVKARAKQFLPGLRAATRQDLSEELVREVYMPYMLLHSLSHLLLTAMSLECGYSAASIRERIYLGDEGYGILLYTGTPDAEGTLGGLVEVGRHLPRHLKAAIELGALCSNDPVCAQHSPDDMHESRAVHGAACHGCLLIAEPSCEHRNELLDRALVVPTVDRTDLAFFGSGE